MKVNIITNEQNIITGLQKYPLLDTLPIIEINSFSDIHLGCDKWINNELIIDDIKYQKERLMNDLTIEIHNLKKFLQDTDYMVVKVMDGALSKKEYAPVKAQRQQARNRINEIEEQLKKTS